MNVAWPAREFDSDSAAVAKFADLLRNGFENPESISGAVKVDIPGHPDLGFVARFGEELAIERGCPETDADTHVSIPVATVHRIFRESEFIDWRGPDIIGTIRFSGDLGLANHLAKSCLRPSDWTIDLLAERFGDATFTSAPPRSARACGSSSGS